MKRKTDIWIEEMLRLQELEFVIEQELGTELSYGSYNPIFPGPNSEFGGRFVEYAWVIRVFRSNPWTTGGILGMKLRAGTVKDKTLPDQLVHAIFGTYVKGKGLAKDEVEHFYSHIAQDVNADKVRETFQECVFDAKGEGRSDRSDVRYTVHVSSNRINTVQDVTNPTGPRWKVWENEVWMLGKMLGEKSGNRWLGDMFRAG
jgi:hypothetical protein